MRVLSNFDFKVRDRVEQKGIEAWLPTVKETSRWSDRTKTVEKPVFGGYVFVRAYHADLDEIRFTPGVVYVVTADGSTPAEIPAVEVDRLREVLESARTATPCPYVAGEEVTIQSGAFAGKTGPVVRTRGSHSVVVSIALLKQSVRVEVDATAIRRTKKQRG